MTRIIKVDCDKWKSRLFISLKILAFIAWGLTIMGLVYAEYYLFTTFSSLNNDLFGIRLTLIIILTIGNGVGIFFTIRIIYRHQNLFKFKCVSAEERKISNGHTKSQYISNKEYFEQKDKTDSK